MGMYAWTGWICMKEWKRVRACVQRAQAKETVRRRVREVRESSAVTHTYAVSHSGVSEAMHIRSNHGLQRINSIEAIVEDMHWLKRDDLSMQDVVVGVVVGVGVDVVLP
jgi:hypothetical protein